MQFKKNIRKFYLVSLILLFVFGTSSTFIPSVSAAPNVLVIGGPITYDDLSPVPNGWYRMNFVMFDDPVLGSANDQTHDMWHELNKTVQIDEGGFLVALGSLTPLPDPSLISTYFLDFQLEGQSYQPQRIELATYNYSYGSGQVDGLGSSQLIQLGQGLQTDTSNNQATIAINKTGAGADIVDLQRDGTSVFSINTNGDTTLRSATNSSTAFLVQSAAAIPDVLIRADSLENVIKIGNDTAAGSEDTTLLVLDSAPTSLTPPGASGGMFYDSSLQKFRCYEDGIWKPCISSMQSAYDTDASAAIVLTDARDFSITTSDTATDPNIVFNLACSTCTGSNGRFGVQASGTDVFTILPDGSIQRLALAGKSITTQLESGSSLQYLATDTPNTDMLQISNASFPVTDNGVNGLHIDYHGGTGAIEASGMRIDYVPGGTSGATWNGLKISSGGGAASGVANYGLVLDGPSAPSTGQETAMRITTGWDLGIDIGSGGIQLANQANPEAPVANSLKIYAKNISGRMLLKAMGPSGVDYPLQPSLFQNQVTMINAQSGTANNLFGTNRTLVGTASHPNADEIFGYMTNYATAATNGSDAGVSNNSAQFFRGSVPGANGFFFNTRIGLPDGSYPSTRTFIGMTSLTTVQSLASDDPNGHRAGFSFSTSRGDTTWQFSTKDGSTESLVDTTLPFTAGKVYDCYVYVTPQGSTIYWRIDNMTDGTSQEGSTALRLPAGNQALRGSIGLSTLSNTARNIRMQRMYIEADR